MRRARRYILRVRPDGTVRVTIPRGGSRAEAANFLNQHQTWVARERARVREVQAPVQWTDGTSILLDGEPVVISLATSPSGIVARYGDRVVSIKDSTDVRAAVEGDLRELARTRLIPRVQDLATELDLTVAGVHIRNQRSRW